MFVLKQQKKATKNVYSKIIKRSSIDQGHLPSLFSQKSVLVDNGKKHVIEQLNSVSAGPEQLYGKSEGISEYLLPLKKTKALINSWVSQWTCRRDLVQPNKVVTSGRALPGSAHMGLSRARRPILVSLQPGHGAAHTPTGTWAFPQAMWYGSSWEDAALPLNQETRTK